MRLEPQHVYVPAGVGGHVDHRLCRDAGLALLGRDAVLGDARARAWSAACRSTRTSRTRGGTAAAVGIRSMTMASSCRTA